MKSTPSLPKTIAMIAMLLPLTTHAGFWSSVAGGLVANSLTSSGKNSKGIDSHQSDEMKVQQALYGLDLYDGNLDGNLNSIESRSAINKFQKKYDIKVSGILENNHIQHLLYIHEIYMKLVSLDKNSSDYFTVRNRLYTSVDEALSLIMQDS